MNTRRQWIIVGAIVAAVAIALVVGTRLLGGELAFVGAGAKAPDFSAVPIPPVAPSRGAGPAPKSLADYKGQVVLLNLWATWCNPCRAEMPSIEKLQQEMGPQGLKIVAVSVDNGGMEDAIRDFRKQFGLTFEVLYDPDGKIESDYQSSGIPETFLIGRDGIIRKRMVGANDWDTDAERALIRQLLAEPGP